MHSCENDMHQLELLAVHLWRWTPTRSLQCQLVASLSDPSMLSAAAPPPQPFAAFLARPYLLLQNTGTD